MTKKKNKKSAMSKAMYWKGLSFGLFIVVLVLGFMFVSGQFQSAGTVKIPGVDGKDGNSNINFGTDFCVQNPSKTLKLRLENSNAITTEYVNGTVYFYDPYGNGGAGTINEVSITGGGTDGFTEIATDLACGGDKPYKVYVKHDGTINSDGVKEVSVSQLAAKKTSIEDTIKVAKFSALKFKAQSEGKDVYDSTNSTDFATGNVSFYEGTGSTEYSLGIGEKLNLDFTIDTVTNKEMFGKAYYIAVETEDESNDQDWDETTMQLTLDGDVLQTVNLATVHGAESPEFTADSDGLKNYERVYLVNEPIGTLSEHKLNFQLEASSDIESDLVDYDVKVYFIPVGDVKSTKISDTILQNVAFQDDSAKTSVGDIQYITIPVQ